MKDEYKSKDSNSENTSFVDFGIKQKEYDGPCEPCCGGDSDGGEKKEKIHYPTLWVNGMKEPDGLPVGEWTTVMMKIKKVSSEEREKPNGGICWESTYEVAGAELPTESGDIVSIGAEVTMKRGSSAEGFAAALEEMMAKKGM